MGAVPRKGNAPFGKLSSLLSTGLEPSTLVANRESDGPLWCSCRAGLGEVRIRCGPTQGHTRGDVNGFSMYLTLPNTSMNTVRSKATRIVFEVGALWRSTGKFRAPGKRWGADVVYKGIHPSGSTIFLSRVACSLPLSLTISSRRTIGSPHLLLA